MKNLLPLVIATRNNGKTAEIRNILENFPVIVKNLDDFGPIPEIEEDGETFDDNAYKKSSMTARILGIPALADDSGLVVSALDGAPGVHSARYGGPGLTDQERCTKLMGEMESIENRDAAFRCVISIAVPTGAALTYEAQCKGTIAQESKGENGFGYDPIFFFPSLKKTFAELTMEEKNRVSHRGKALREVATEFDKVLTWIRQNMPIQEKSKCNK